MDQAISIIVSEALRIEEHATLSDQRNFNASDFLDAASDEISLEKARFDQLKLQKMSLIQQLFTGKVRGSV